MAEPQHRMFVLPIRVPYAHTDQMGMVYYANYLIYFEMARSALLREIGLPYGELEKRGVYLPVVEAHCEYRKPARFDELIEVRSRCTEIRGIRLHIEYEVVRGSETLARGHTDHVCMAPDGRVLRPTAEVQGLVQLRGE